MDKKFTLVNSCSRVSELSPGLMVLGVLDPLPPLLLPLTGIGIDLVIPPKSGSAVLDWIQKIKNKIKELKKRNFHQIKK